MNRTLLILVLSLFMSLESNSQVYQAVGTFVNTKNIKIGKVDIMEQGDGSNFRIQLETLTPGLYAMHIHEKGLCDSQDFISAGGHHGLRADGTFSGDFKPIYVKNDVS